MFWRCAVLSTVLTLFRVQIRLCISDINVLETDQNLLEEKDF